ncbi:Ankyrin-3 [Trichoderma ghanense]|uniref:Ankyrin-3 n=1 Tax=Trichoderma ghanense TaxID=65468 RepID=A0ABY2H5G2_9HYPO
MAGPAQGEQIDGGCFAVLSSYLKRKGKKRNGTKSSHGPLSETEAAPGKGADLSTPPAVPPDTFQETNAAINDKSVETPTDLTQQSVEPGKKEIDDSGLWSRAYQDLDGKTKEWIDAANQNHGEERIQDLATLVKKREEKYKEETPKLRVGAYEVIWRDYAKRVVMWVTTIGDIATGFAPAPIPVVWSALEVLLKANVSQCEDLAAIFGCADEVLRLIRLGKVYHDVYLSGGPRNGVTQNLQNALVDLYKSLMELLAHAFTRLNEGKGSQFLRALVYGGQGEKLVSALAEKESKVSMAAHGCGAVASQEHQKLLESLEKPLRNVEDTVQKLVQKIDQDALENALEYISNIPIGEHQQEKRESRTATTCEWLLNHPEFREWERSDCSSTLWLQGNVGAGKSFLTSKVIDHLSATCQQESEYDQGFAYFYCSRSDPVRRETKYILRSYISQLARVPNHPTMTEKNIHMLYLKAKQEKRGFSLAECKTALIELVNFYPRTIFILDALDECARDTREALVRILRNLVNTGEGTVKVFIASRKEDDIQEYLGSQKVVVISTADNKNDIEKYIEEEMAKVGGAWKSVSAEVKEQVKTTIREKSDGMFRWAYLQWQQLKKLRTNETIRERLGKLPGTLTEAYDEIYSQTEEKVVLQRAVKWVLCAGKPLTSDVLLTAVRLGRNLQYPAASDPIDESTLESNLPSLTLIDPIDESTFESICSHLIVLDLRLRVWKFPHASVAEYFEDRHKSWIGRAPEDVAILVVSCLIDCYSEWAPPELEDEAREFLRKTPDLDNHLDPRHPLQEYASLYWVQHARNTAYQLHEAPGLSDILKRFLGTKGPQKSSSRQYQAWCQLQDIRADMMLNFFDFGDVRPSEKSIFGICRLGLHTLLKGWWDKDIDVSQVNSRGLDLLALAADYGHDELCSELIDRGGDIHRELDRGLGSAFMETIAGSHIKVVTLFLKEGVDPNLPRRGRSPLCLAAEECGEELVETLLKAGADPNLACPACSCGCALAAAASDNKVGVVKLLLKYKANVNLADEYSDYRSPLGAAAYWGSLECAKLLVMNGAEVDAQFDGGYGSVLGAAACGWGGVEMVKYLIEEAGADPAVLFSSPPRLPDSPGVRRDTKINVARYLIEAGYVQESALLSIRFFRTALANEET